MAVTPRKTTPISLEQSVELLVNTFSQVFGRPPTQNEAAFLQAQVWLETGRGRKTQNHNVGNITATSGWVNAGRPFWRPPWFDPNEFEKLPDGRTKDRYRKLHQLMLEKKAPSRFRAYGSFAEAFDDYISMLKRRFPTIVEAARTGDPATFALAVRDSRYCPDCDPRKTTNSFDRLSREVKASGLLSSLQEGAAPLPLPLTPEEQAGQGSFSEPSASPSFGEFGKRLVDYDMPTLREGAHSLGVQLWQRLVNIVLAHDEPMQIRAAELAEQSSPIARLKVDSDFGPVTAAATQALQEFRNLKADRVVGRRTWSSVP